MINIPNHKMPEVLNGIDRVAEKAGQVFTQIPKKAFEDAQVRDFTASDVAARVSKKLEDAPAAPTPETKRPTLG